MKRVTSGVLAALLLLGFFFVEPTAVFAESEDAVQETLATEMTTESTSGETGDSTTPPESENEGVGETEKDNEEENDNETGKDNEEEKEEQIPENTYTGPTISEDGMWILKQEEGFSKYPYYDYTQWTVGYGTYCPDDKLDEYRKNGITEEAAEILLHNHLIGVYEDLVEFSNKYSLTFTQNQFDALVLFSYNCGTGWTFDSSGTLPTALRKGATGSELIRSFAVWCNAGGSIQTYLIRRRLCEAYMYLEGKYVQTPPSNYCYTLFDPDGGTVKSKIQGYNSDEPAAIFHQPTLSGYTFDGWYTEKTGGTKVTTLDATTKSKTLYAHWKDAQGNDLVAAEKEINATVTSDGVNVRKGPGTNYVTVGSKNKGDEILITETASGSGLRWGKISEGWICLTYTDYENSSSGSDDTATASVWGTVISDEFLRIRSGPSTSYEEIGRLKAGDYVEILEQKVVGGSTWGRIDRGWISMYYIRLDTDEKETEDNTATTPETWTGTIINSDGGLRVRGGAGTNYPIASYLYTGDAVTITEQKTVGSVTWGKTAIGWISMDYVKLDGGSADNSGSTGSTGSAGTTTSQTGSITASSLCIRNYAGTASPVVGYLSKGTRVTITQTTTVNGSKWGKVEKGWISMDYVKLDSSTSDDNQSDSETDNSATATTYIGTVVNCSEFLRIRSGAGTEYDHIGYVYPGDKLTITEFKMNGSVKWARIDKGWVSMDYIRLETEGSDSGTTGETKTVTANCLCVRRTAGTSGTVVGYLYYGTKVTILETTTVNGNPWGRTSQGWISLNYVK